MTSLRASAIALLWACSGFGQEAPHPANPAFQAMVRDAKTRIREIDAAQLKTWLDSPDKLLLIDVREDSEWQAGHAAAATHLSRGILDARIESAAPEKAARIVLYCHSGARSALAADTLRKMGYRNVFSLAGGFQSYQSAGLPVQK